VTGTLSVPGNLRAALSEFVAAEGIRVGVVPTDDNCTVQVVVANERRRCGSWAYGPGKWVSS